MFDTTKEDLKDLLRKVDEGKLQLPDFQRDYVWGDEDRRMIITRRPLSIRGGCEREPRLTVDQPLIAIDRS